MTGVRDSPLVTSILLLSAFCGTIHASRSLLVVNGEDAPSGRYPYFVSLRDQNYSYSYSSSYASPPRAAAGAPSSSQKLVHKCGGILISDWLVLTTATCAPQNRVALASDFTAAGLPFTKFPNTYVPSTTYRDNVTVYVGAENLDVGSAQGNPVRMWFVHPWYSESGVQYDIAVGLLTSPERSAAKAKLADSVDIYDFLSADANISSIGLGNVLGSVAARALQAISNNFTNPNTDPQRKLEEVVLGTLSLRVPCGKILTNYSTSPYSSTSGNVEFDSSSLINTATIINNGQFCIQPRQPVGPTAARQGRFDTSALNLYNDTCIGDAGGPAFIKGATASDDVIVGLNSWGFGCGGKNPGVYTNIAGFKNDTLFDNFLTDIMGKVPDSFAGRPSTSPSLVGQGPTRSSSPSTPSLAASAPVPSSAGSLG